MTSKRNWASKKRLSAVGLQKPHWLISLLIHLGLACALLWTGPTPLRPHELVEVEWVETSSSPAAGAKGATPESLRAINPSIQHSARPSVAQILQTKITGRKNPPPNQDPVIEALRGLSDPAPRNSQGGPSKSNTGGFGGDGTDPYASPIDSLETAIELDPFYKALAETLTPHLTYPEDLVLQYIDGSVHVELEVNGQGQIEGDRIKFRGDHPALEAYVVATLYEVLKDPLPHRQWVSRSKIPVKFEFRFIRLLPESRVERTHTALAGHHIQFSRYAYLRPQILGQTVERFLEKYWPPVIITPGLVMIDFIRLYEMIKAHHEPDRHELREFRIRTLQEVRRKKIESRQDSQGTLHQSAPN